MPRARNAERPHEMRRREGRRDGSLAFRNPLTPLNAAVARKETSFVRVGEKYIELKVYREIYEQRDLERNCVIKRVSKRKSHA